MKTTPLYLPAALLAGFFIFSCSNGERAPMGDYSTRQSDKAKMDSMSAPASSSSTLFKQEQQEEKNATEFLSGNNNESEGKVTLESMIGPVSSSAAKPNRLDSTHRFIRSADIRFRVNSVSGATYRIEDITRRFGGWVADTRLASELQSSNEKPVSADSSLETMRYVVTNSIRLRVPVENLDTLLKSLVPLIDYLDYRNINTNDITFDLIANRLAQARIFRYNTRMANDIDSKGKKLPDLQSAEESMLNQQAQSDNALIDNLRQDDQVRYSTITLYIYQRETIRQELVKREKDVEAYEPGLGTKLYEASRAGWHGLQAVITALVLLWPMWVIGAALYFFIRWALKRAKRKEAPFTNQPGAKE